jgi:hypothetical protein
MSNFQSQFAQALQSKIGLQGAQTFKADQEGAWHGADIRSQIGLRGAQGNEAFATAGLRNAQEKVALNGIKPVSSPLSFAGTAGDSFTGALPTGPTIRGDRELLPSAIDYLDNTQPFGARKGATRITDPNGSPTVDTVPAKLADGEAVLNAGASEILGRNEIAKLNKDGLIRMGLSPNIKPKMKDGVLHAFGGKNYTDSKVIAEGNAKDFIKGAEGAASRQAAAAPAQAIQTAASAAPVTPTVAPSANAGTAELKILADQVKNGEATSPNYKHSPLDTRTGPTVTKAGTIHAGQGVPRSLSLIVPNPTNVVPAGAASVPTVPPGTSVVPAGPLKSAPSNAAPSAKGAAFTSEELKANRARAAAGQAAQDAARSQHRVINIPKASPSLASRGWGLMKSGFKAATGPIGLGITAALHSKELANDDAMFAPGGRFRMTEEEAKVKAAGTNKVEENKVDSTAPAIQAPTDPDEAAYSKYFNAHGITDKMRKEGAAGMTDMSDAGNKIYKMVDKDGKVTYTGMGSPTRVAAEKVKAEEPKTKEAVEIKAAQAALEDNAILRDIRDKAIKGEPEAIKAWNMINQKTAPKDEWEHVIQKSTDAQGNVTETPMLYNKSTGKFAQNNQPQQFIEGRIYRDKDGNQSRYVNGKFEEVK